LNIALSSLQSRPQGVSADFLRHIVVWVLFASSFFVLIEPAPCDVFFILAVLLFSSSGLHLSAAALPLVVLQILFLVGGLTGLTLVLNESRSVIYVVTSAYMVFASIFLAFYLGRDALWRSKLVINGWIFGAVVATVFGLIGAFDIAGTGSWMSLQGRAQGLFKDPNVYSTYIILPCVVLLQKILIGNTRHSVLSGLLLLFLLSGLFLAFSRGAWLNFICASALLVLISFVMTQSMTLRARIVLIVMAGLIAAAALLAGLLLIEPVRDLFFERFSFTQSYDGGETGRFGNQLISLPKLLVSPLGFGPINFRNLFYQDPHNVYINAFASYGWLGGFSYFALIVATLVVGTKSLVRESALQPLATAAFCVFVSTSLQGVQIDTDHWRHFYWLMGIVWGLYVAQLNPAEVAVTRKLVLTR
jgi:hypothetical protein